MAWFQLDPQSLADRARESGAGVLGLRASLLRGALGFTAVSVAGFVPWAVFGRPLHRLLGEAGMYGVCALVFVGLSGPMLHRLILGPGSLGRFWRLFSLAFTAYSAAWIAGWMALRGHPGSIAGLLAGTAVMGWMLCTAFDARRELIRVVAGLFVLNSAGYFLGGELEGALIRRQAVAAMLLWGVCYGLGLGAGLGLAFHFCQRRARELLAGVT